jgi:hypothetical protein
MALWETLIIVFPEKAATSVGVGNDPTGVIVASDPV